jgi:hypothetical protein
LASGRRLITLKPGPLKLHIPKRDSEISSSVGVEIGGDRKSTFPIIGPLIFPDEADGFLRVPRPCHAKHVLYPRTPWENARNNDIGFFFGRNYGERAKRLLEKITDKADLQREPWPKMSCANFYRSTHHQTSLEKELPPWATCNKQLTLVLASRSTFAEIVPSLKQAENDIFRYSFSLQAALRIILVSAGINKLSKAVESLC